MKLMKTFCFHTYLAYPTRPANGPGPDSRASMDRGAAPRVWEAGAGVGGGAPDPEAWFGTAAPVWPASARSGDSSGGVGGDGTVWAGGLGLIGVAKEVGECKKGGGKRGEGRAGGLISSPTRVWGSSTPKKPE